MDINDIDEIEEPITGQNQEPPEQNVSNQEPNNKDEDDIITSLLKDRGISDSSKIKFEDENGVVSEKSWNDLTKQEQLNILNQSPTSDPDVDLDDSEIQMLNQMRLAGMNPEQYVTALRNQGAEYIKNQYQQNQNEESYYKTDDLTDDELYVLDLQYRSPDMTDEEIAKSLNAAKQDEELFTKQVNGLRTYYRNLEQEEQSRKDLEEQEKEQTEFKEFSNKINSSISDLNSIGNLDVSLSDDDKNELSEFILGRDQAGINWFGKALEDPDTVVRMAWFALKGEDMFNEIENYITQQIKTTAQNSYNKGLEDGKNKKTSPKVVVTSPQHTNNYLNQTNEPIGLENIDF